MDRAAADCLPDAANSPEQTRQAADFSKVSAIADALGKGFPQAPEIS